MKYRKKPVEVEAVKFVPGEMLVDWLCNAVLEDRIDIHHMVGGMEETSWLYIKTLEGIMVAREGDYIIRGVNGEIYPCKSDIFEATYELVEE